MGSGKSGLYSGATTSLPFPGSADYTRKGDPFSENIKKRSDVDINGFYDVIAHGSPETIIIEHNGIEIEVDHRTAAALLKRDAHYRGKSIRLLSCDTGLLKTGFAQNLANKLNVLVKAPTSWVWAYPDGHYIVATRDKNGQPDFSKRGRFVTFYPGGKKK